MSVGWFGAAAAFLALAVAVLVSSLATVWGLFRHYSVLIKLLITAMATGVLLVHMGPISGLAATAAETSMSAAGFLGLRIQVDRLRATSTAQDATIDRYGPRKVEKPTSRGEPHD